MTAVNFRPVCDDLGSNAGTLSAEKAVQQALERALNGDEKVLRLSGLRLTEFPASLLCSQEDGNSSVQAKRGASFYNGGARAGSSRKEVDLRWDSNPRGESSRTTASAASTTTAARQPQPGRARALNSRLQPNAAFFHNEKKVNPAARWWEEEEVRALDLGENELEQLPQNLFASPLFARLEKLDISSNRFQGGFALLVEDMLADLKTFDCRGNLLERIAIPETLVELRCAGNAVLREIVVAPVAPSRGQCESQLAILDGETNAIAVPWVQSVLPCFPNLVRLNLKQNQLSGAFPALHLPRLVDLDLDKNRLETLDLGGFPALRTCSAAQNVLSLLKSSACCDFASLDTLQLAYNRLSGTLTDAVAISSGLQRLTVLLLANNALTSLPEDLDARFPALQTLDVQNNDLGSLPLTLGNMAGLKRIALEGNAIRSIRPHVLRGGVEDLKKYLRSRVVENDAVGGSDTVPSSLSPGKIMASGSTVSSSSAGDPACSCTAGNSSALSAPYSKNVYFQRTKFSSLKELLPHGESASAAGVTAIDLEQCSGPAEEAQSVCALFHDAHETLKTMRVVRCGWRNNPTGSLIFYFPFLRSLDLSRNFFTSFPHLSHCHALHDVSFRGNKFTQLCGHDLKKNLLGFAGDEVSGTAPAVKKLSVLDLSENEISEIVNGDQFLLPQLQYLNTVLLQNNSLREASIPVSWGTWEGLRSIPLDGNFCRRYADMISKKGVEAWKKYLREKADAEGRAANFGWN